MASINGAARTNICRHYSSYYYYPVTATAQLICQKLHFHRLVSTENTNSRYPFRTRYNSGMYHLRGCNPTCSYSSSTRCSGSSYYTYISCACAGSYYATSRGCLPCPANSANATGLVDRCSCEAGLYWEHGHCKTCPAYQYSSANSTACTLCPNGATSEPGSDHCTCFAGLYMEEEECRKCTDNTFSVRNSTSCTACPVNSTVTADHTSCVCQGSALWNPISNNCTETQRQSPDETPVPTTPQPNNTTDQPGNVTTGISNNTAAPQKPDQRRENPHPVTTALLVVILVVALACLAVLVVKQSLEKTRKPPVLIRKPSAYQTMSALPDRDLPAGPPPQPPACCVDDEDIYVEQD